MQRKAKQLKTEVRDDVGRVFKNGDVPAHTKDLTNKKIMKLALDAAFHSRPSYFSPKK